MADIASTSTQPVVKAESNQEIKLIFTEDPPETEEPSCGEVSVTMPSYVIDMMVMLKHMIADTSDDSTDQSTEIHVGPLRLRKRIFDIIIEWCRYTHDNNVVREMSVKGLAKPTDWDTTFFKDVNHNDRLEIMLGANFLEVKPLLYVITAVIANSLKGKTKEEMRQILKVKNDFTPEEEAKIEGSLKWATSAQIPKKQTSS